MGFTGAALSLSHDRQQVMAQGLGPAHRSQLIASSIAAARRSFSCAFFRLKVDAREKEFSEADLETDVTDDGEPTVFGRPPLYMLTIACRVAVVTRWLHGGYAVVTCQRSPGWLHGGYTVVTRLAIACRMAVLRSDSTSSTR